MNLFKLAMLTVSTAAAVAVSGCKCTELENKMLNAPWEKSKFFKKITHKTGVVSYLLTTDVSHNQQSLYFVTKEMTDDGRFLVFQLVDEEDFSRDNLRIYRTIAYIDFLHDTLTVTDIRTLRGGNGAYVDPANARIFCMSDAGLHMLDLRKGEKKSRLITPMPESIKKLGKNFRYYCTHLTMSKDNKKAFLDLQYDDSFTHGVLNVEDGTFTPWATTPFYANHGQFNPQNPDMAMCAWEVDWVDSKGRQHHIRDHKELYYPRLWIMRSNGKRQMIPSVTNYATHEVWAQDGKGFIFCSTNNNQGVIYHDLATGLQRQVMAPVWLEKENRAATASHADISSDNRYIVCDIGAGVSAGYPWRMAFGNTETGKTTIIYDDLQAYRTPEMPRTLLHPHPHPHCVFKDKVIVSTYFPELKKMQIMLTPVEQLIKANDR
ncbi:MAG: hypothetical protein IJC21_00410 [Lentisphaeria bacterium]|nr:hypothetical protein [Lentisphaeria bacterium]